MIANTHSLASKAKHLGTTLVAATALMGATQAWADPEIQSAPLGVYVGGAAGFGVNSRDCEQFPNTPGGYCERLAVSGKLFGGYRMTPGLAAEVNYFYFGGVNRGAALQSNAYVAGDVDFAQVRDSARALTLGINWEIELFSVITNHVRLGVAWVHSDTRGVVNTITTSSPTAKATASVNKDSSDFGIAPYVGVGLSLPLNDYLRFQTGYDLLLKKGSKTLQLFSVGASADF